MSERQRTRIADWIQDGVSTIDEDDGGDTATCAVSQLDAFVDAFTSGYHDAQTTHTSTRKGSAELLAETPYELDWDIEMHVIKHLEKCAKSKSDCGEYAAAETCLTKVLRRSEANTWRSIRRER